MRAVCGEVNDSCYIHFGVEIQGVQSTDMWTGDKTLVRGSSAIQKGKFKSTSGDIFLTEKAFVNYKDLLNTIQIIVTESKLAPLSRIRIGLPNSDKYNVSEFFIKGHLEIEAINVISRKKTVPGEPVMKQLRDGKKINLLDKLFIEKMGEPLLVMASLETGIGTIQQIKTYSNIEI